VDFTGKIRSVQQAALDIVMVGTGNNLMDDYYYSKPRYTSDKQATRKHFMSIVADFNASLF
jgi:hypothetical protein